MMKAEPMGGGEQSLLESVEDLGGQVIPVLRR